MSYQQFRPSSFNILPVVVKNLFIINGLFLLATFVLGQQGINLQDKLGLHFVLSEKFQPYQFVTYMFMHADGAHLFSNMLTLWIFGSVIENYWGPKRFLTYYIVTGMGAALIHYLILYFGTMKPFIEMIDSYPGFSDAGQFISFFQSLPPVHFSPALRELGNQYDSVLTVNQHAPELGQIAHDILRQYKMEIYNAPLIVGASGSVFGVLLAFGMLFPNSTPFYLIPIKAKWIVLFYGLAELGSGIANNPGDNVAHFAHLGGMFIGFLLIKYWQRNRTRFY